MSRRSQWFLDALGLSLFFLFSIAQLQAEMRTSTLTGEIRFHRDFPATKLQNQRTIAIYLPPGYEEEKNARYPVLYMHDGQNIFDAFTSFIGKEWEVDETAERLMQEGKIQKIIVVGIYNNADRLNEYTPWKDSKHGGGNAELYADFIVSDLKPFIDKTYRTLPDRKNTAVCGSSLGGLVSFYLLWNFPRIFSKGAVLSPAVWWADYAVLKEIERTKEKKDLKIWLDMGTQEGKTLQFFEQGIADARKMRDALLKKGFVSGKNFSYYEDEGAVHNETAWAKRMPMVLEFLFGGK